MKTFFIYIKSFLDFLTLKFFQTITLSVKDRSNNLLFINTGQIGDLIVSSLLFENDNLLNNNGKYYFLLQERYQKLFVNYNGIIKFIGINVESYKYNLIYRFRVNSYLRQLNIKKVYNLTSARSTWNDILALGIGTKENYCYKNTWKSVKKVFGNFTDAIYTNQVGKSFFNEYDRINSVINDIAKKEELENNPKTKVFFCTNKNKNYDIIIAPFSFNGNRDIKISYINEIISSFDNSQILILCSKKQRGQLYRINNYGNLTIAAGKYKLNQLFSLINSSKVFIGIDSGLTHIALKTNTITIAVIGGGNYGKYLPKPNDNKTIYLNAQCEYFGCEWHCKKEKVFCVENVSANKIISEVNNILGKYENS